MPAFPLPARIVLLALAGACSKPHPAAGTDTTTPSTPTAVNAPPTAPVVAISPAEPHDNHDLICAITTEATDPDGDAVTHELAWTVDGAPWTGDLGTTTRDGDTVAAADTAAGQSWTCTVTPSDPTEAGPSGEDTVTIAEVSCLAGYWPFDEGTGAIAADVSGRGNDGTLSGDASWVAGRVAGGVGFDGDDDYVTMGDVLNGLQLPVALSAWVWMDGADYFRIVNTDDDDLLYSGLFLAVTPENKLSASFGDGLGGGGYQWRRTATSNGTLPRQTWVHVAAILRGGVDMELYVDGVLVPATYDGAGGALSTTNFPFHVGRTLDSPTESLGAIDELRVYDCDPGAAEIAATANP